MKTVYFRELKSGNFELSTKKDSTVRFNTKIGLFEFFKMISERRSKVWNRRKFEPCRIIKARYSKTQTYFNSAEELYKFITK